MSIWLGKLAGGALMLFGAWIMLIYWVYTLRVLAMRCGLGQVRYSSFTPLVAPICILLGALLYPLAEPFRWLGWALLLDTNSYVLLLSLLLLPWRQARRPKP